jgi:hypothetical protein
VNLPCWLSRFFASFRYAKHIDPPVVSCPTITEAWAQATALAGTFGGLVKVTSGTPSMVPIIPAAPTYLTIKPKPFAEIRLGEIAIYQSPLSPTGCMCHRIVAPGDSSGYIASGDNNRWSEAKNYVREANYIGEVVGIFTVAA